MADRIIAMRKALRDGLAKVRYWCAVYWSRHKHTYTNTHARTDTHTNLHTIWGGLHWVCATQSIETHGLGMFLRSVYPPFGPRDQNVQARTQKHALTEASLLRRPNCTEEARAYHMQTHTRTDACYTSPSHACPTPTPTHPPTQPHTPTHAHTHARARTLHSAGGVISQLAAHH